MSASRRVPVVVYNAEYPDEQDPQKLSFHRKQASNRYWIVEDGRKRSGLWEDSVRNFAVAQIV